MTEKISVIIITRNRAKMLVGCLESLVKQTHLPDEVIVVNNASTDSTKKTVLSFKKKLHIKYVLENKIGIPYARNRGLQHTTGELILMLDDDCQADRFWVERMANAHKKYPKAWVIQGRTFSLPYKNAYSIFAEFERFLYLKDSTRKYFLKMKDFFRKDFRDEIDILICDTNNFSIKTSYLKNNKLSFDTRFYRGSDTDLGKQILQKNGIIVFYPSAMVGHWERSNLTQFLEQRWHIGRTAARIADKWKTPSLTLKVMQGPEKLLSFIIFCKVSNQLINLPIPLILFFLDKLYYLNGYFFEKRVLSHSRHSALLRSVS